MADLGRSDREPLAPGCARRELHQTRDDFARLWRYLRDDIAQWPRISAWRIRRRPEFCFTCDRQPLLAHRHHNVHPNLPPVRELR